MFNFYLRAFNENCEMKNDCFNFISFRHFVKTLLQSCISGSNKQFLCGLEKHSGKKRYKFYFDSEGEMRALYSFGENTFCFCHVVKLNRKIVELGGRTANKFGMVMGKFRIDVFYVSRQKRWFGRSNYQGSFFKNSLKWVPRFLFRSALWWI